MRWDGWMGWMDASHVVEALFRTSNLSRAKTTRTLHNLAPPRLYQSAVFDEEKVPIFSSPLRPRCRRRRCPCPISKAIASAEPRVQERDCGSQVAGRRRMRQSAVRPTSCSGTRFEARVRPGGTVRGMATGLAMPNSARWVERFCFSLDDEVQIVIPLT
ncbi:hypothetical protein BDZ90DRAFT_121897 [Jaminaea rosea]|uniref:Uncharacterized protein n=1 Tax=Jaminaea rosea TaxID=1569628 RepID=A0A316UHH7_9BASI|nr:hypothetical protein BDZ90DRAFT_121897 [Jaminaea rosea]PWN24358.1 hypothetical protein BDZ90DRAFT_121897 [Jaminaea rosea]